MHRLSGEGDAGFVQGIKVRAPSPNMQNANYTSENICRALGLGGFANDSHLAKASQAIRLLLTPSFSPEACITLCRADNEITASVVAARSQIWQQVWPAPKPTAVDSAIGQISAAVFERLASLLDMAAQPGASPRITVVLDGMRAHSVLRNGGEGRINISENASREGPYATFVAQTISETWHVIDNLFAKNALREAGSYVGLSLPEQDTPPTKTTINTVVLGPEDVAAQVLAALKKHHEG